MGDNYADYSGMTASNALNNSLQNKSEIAILMDDVRFLAAYLNIKLPSQIAEEQELFAIVKDINKYLNRAQGLKEYSKPEIYKQEVFTLKDVGWMIKHIYGFLSETYGRDKSGHDMWARRAEWVQDGTLDDIRTASSQLLR